LRIYITYCSAQKDDSLRDTGIEVTPDRLYKSRRVKAFMARCKVKAVNWAIFSDEHGVWFSHIKHKWYEKDPSTIVRRGKIIDPVKFGNLVEDFNHKLRGYQEIHFYVPNATRLHSLYWMLLKKTRLKGRVRQFDHISKIDC
jgi:hypothetical protein